jgi:hypothetical protein
MVKFKEGKTYLYLGPQIVPEGWDDEMSFVFGHKIIHCREVHQNNEKNNCLNLRLSLSAQPNDHAQWYDWRINSQYWIEVLSKSDNLTQGIGYFNDGEMYTHAFDFGKKESTVAPGIYEFAIIGEMFPKPALMFLPEGEEYQFTPTVHFKKLKEILDTFLSKKEDYKRVGVPHHEGILLDGPPGTGKTTIASELANYLVQKGGIAVWCKTPDSFQSSVDFIRANDKEIPILLIVDELDKVRFDSKVLSTFLSGPTPLNGVLTLYTSNNTAKLPDSLIRRPGRIRHRISVETVDPEAYKQIIRSKIPTIDEKVLEKIVQKLPGMPIDGVILIVLNHSVYGMEIETAINQALKFYRDSHKTNSNKSWTPGDDDFGSDGEEPEKIEEEYEEDSFTGPAIVGTAMAAR